MRHYRSFGARAISTTLSLVSAALLSACGGSGSSPVITTTPSPAPPASESYTLTLDSSVAAPGYAQPAFHLAPVVLEPPGAEDRIDPMTSAAHGPRIEAVDPRLAQLATRRLTGQILHQFLQTGSAPASAYADGSLAKPFSTGATVAVYTPAQIRAAYSLPPLPSTTSSLTSAQAAQLGAGQTIYLIDAQDDPNSSTELAAFNSQFGLPSCAVTPIPVAATLPLAAAPTNGCSFSVVYSTVAGGMTASAPAYNSGWATEIALDVQWAHATAPYARIILIEAPDASVTSLSAAVALANQMGPGVVSQSFGAAEGSWVSAYDANFTAPNMTYLAAAGDAGAEVEWPAVSSNVLAVAGTSLTYAGGAPRSETVWSGTGGGISAYVSTPSYQGLAVPGLSAPAHRAVSDVAFNADPNTGEFLAVMPQNSTSVSWYSVGGTSLATPQWAGILAVANALRGQSAETPLGAAQSVLYALATQQASYASAFLDVTQGSDGSCTTCFAGVGYDLPSGLGSPNVTALLSSLGGPPPGPAPVVNGASVSGTVGTALTFAISATGAHALTYSLTGAPTGMSVNPSSGLVTWSSPIAGAYTLTAQATDTESGLSGQGAISVTIAPPQPPQVIPGSVAGSAQVPLTFSTMVLDANPVSYSLTGAPAGMTISAAGVASWPDPLAGSYSVTVVAQDTTTGLNGQAAYSVVIQAAKAPVVSPDEIAGTVGIPLTFTVNASAANPLTFSLSGAPTGMSIDEGTGAVTWSNPTAGSFQVMVTAQDTKTGLTGQGAYTVSITAGGPTISATNLAGVSGSALSGAITFSDRSSSTLTVTVTGLPTGMNLSVAGNSLLVKWPTPVAGSYALGVSAVDTKGLSASTSISVSISAH